MLIIDTCSLGVGKNPGGGFTLKLTGIEGCGALDGMDILIPVYGPAATQLVGEIQKVIGPTLQPATLADMPGSNNA